MRQLYFFILFFLLLACSSESIQEGSETIEITEQIPVGDNSKTSLDWNGAYKSILPCADCEGIAIQIQLNVDETYEMNSRYLGRSEEVYTAIGSFEWDEAGGKISLLIEGQNPKLHQYQVGENALFKLDTDGNRIGKFDSPYTLVKVGSVLDY
jgi:uncharacterized lipoprotein NlpE involved in copper resistance